MAVVKIPPVLRASVGGQREISAPGGSIAEVLEALVEAHPGTRSQLFGADGELNRYVNVYLGDEDVRVLDGLATTVGESDVVVILPAMAGGIQWPARRRSPRDGAPFAQEPSASGLAGVGGRLSWR